jgi:cupin fold WbuC family metalloprotein
MIHIDHHLTGSLIEQARSSARRRKNFNFHPAPSDPMHRMLHAMEPDTYVQPHKHENPDKYEAFIILKGKVAAVEFSAGGEILDWIILDATAGNYGMEVPPRTWHSLVCLESGTVVYEVKNGPWDPSDDKHFANWAPREGTEGCARFNQTILEKIGIV